MTDPSELRHVRLEMGYTLQTWETGKRAPTGQELIRYEFKTPEGVVLFSGEDAGVSPMHCIDSDDALRGLLVFLTLQPGDTDDEYFASYTPEQMAFAESSDAEWLSAYSNDDDDLAFVNLDGWEE